MINIAEAFERFEDDFLQFSEIENPIYPRPDVCAFLLLDKLLPPKVGCDMVTSTGHDEIFLIVDCAELSKVATDDDILTLVRCGVRYSKHEDALCMFV